MPAVTRRTAGARPFLKWAGGKSQLLPEIHRRLPSGLASGGITRYVEPFLGSGAVFFDVSRHYTLEEYVLMDANADLVRTYQSIRGNVEELIGVLGTMERAYQHLAPDKQQEYYYRVRDAFNEGVADGETEMDTASRVERAARLLFLNKTCFNGLFRVNSRGLFNVPFGRYTHPTICNAANLRLAARALQSATICSGDFEASGKHVDAATFVYFDPPYRPLSNTAQFTSYAASPFDDRAQHRLAVFFRRLDASGAKLMLSNSDPKNETPEDDFFEKAYAGFTIERIKAKRTINSNATRRGRINELIITNYPDTMGAPRK